MSHGRAAYRTRGLDGVLLIDKDPGPTSHDVVAACRRILGEKRIGHLGTLDPIAGGLLPMAIGQATRLTRFFLMERKSYRGAMRLGYSTDTYDRAGKRVSDEASSFPSLEEIRRQARSYVGRIRLTIPPYSARKVGGKKLYELARQGEIVITEPKLVDIYALDIERFDNGLVEFFVDCSTGTYVRSVAHELGMKLGCGAHLDSLRRLQVGEFSIDRAVTLDQLRAARDDGKEAPFLLPMSGLLSSFDSITLTSADVREITFGKDILRKLNSVPTSKYLKLMDPSGALLIAIGEMVDRHSIIITIHPAVVLIRP